MNASGPCPQCGATYADPTLSCAERFDALLALDHARSEPWGSRHGVAFATYTLQHPRGHARKVLERCWLILYRVVVEGDDPLRLAASLRGKPASQLALYGVPPLPQSVPNTFALTIADLGEFLSERYASDSERWASATIARLMDND